MGAKLHEPRKDDDRFNRLVDNVASTPTSIADELQNGIRKTTSTFTADAIAAAASSSPFLESSLCRIPHVAEVQKINPITSRGDEAGPSDCAKAPINNDGSVGAASNNTGHRWTGKLPRIIGRNGRNTYRKAFQRSHPDWRSKRM